MYRKKKDCNSEHSTAEVFQALFVVAAWSDGMLSAKFMCCMFRTKNLIKSHNAIQARCTRNPLRSLHIWLVIMFMSLRNQKHFIVAKSFIPLLTLNYLVLYVVLAFKCE